ncbi:MAG: hypothetical protein K2Y37_06475 [Pirellulales bacterium]|nr:hypothetical protein [Pirellulales bacterium]
MDRPPPPEARVPRSSALSIILAALLALFVGAVLIVLTIGFFANVMAAIAILFGVAALHYVVWGRWLSQSLRDEADADEQYAQADSRRDRLPTDRDNYP